MCLKILAVFLILNWKNEYIPGITLQAQLSGNVNYNHNIIKQMDCVHETEKSSTVFCLMCFQKALKYSCDVQWTLNKELLEAQ